MWVQQFITKQFWLFKWESTNLLSILNKTFNLTYLKRSTEKSFFIPYTLFLFHKGKRFRCHLSGTCPSTVSLISSIEVSANLQTGSSCREHWPSGRAARLWGEPPNNVPPCLRHLICLLGTYVAFARQISFESASSRPIFTSARISSQNENWMFAVASRIFFHQQSLWFRNIFSLRTNGHIIQCFNITHTAVSLKKIFKQVV